MRKAYFIDLDNTVYFTKPYANLLLGGLYDFLAQQNLGISAEEYLLAKDELLSYPFLKVAKKYNFSPELISKALVFLKDEEVLLPLETHHEYHFIKALSGLKFMVTAGFEKKQKTKLNMLDIADDFDAVYVVDIAKSTKKDTFVNIMTNYGLKPEDILIIGDDADSEIRYGMELGIETFLYDPELKYATAQTTYHRQTLEGIETL